MTANKVLETIKLVVENSEYVKINYEKLDSVAKRFAKEKLKIPSWEAPVFPEKNNKNTIDFILLANSINFAYTDFNTFEKYSTTFEGMKWRGAFGMYAALKRALNKSIDLLNGAYLENISEKQMKEIFNGNIEIPLLKDRLDIFHEVGGILNNKYSGHFYNLVEDTNCRLFNNGKGLVERLTSEFPSFNDSVIYKGKLVRFDKRAQLGPAMLYGRFRNQGTFKVNDIEELTVFADYCLPKGLRDLEILKYKPELAEKVDNKKLIRAGSQEELELRALTIHASKELENKINQYRDNNYVNALHIDYKLWSESRNKKSPHHLTKTIMY
ncbi:hypothetical protein JW949_04105 [Candidatus Woesearchaeota archaeon]|nr:hypothetical protein [Candidatus Woesearchaeota archaeon]